MRSDGQSVTVPHLWVRVSHAGKPLTVLSYPEAVPWSSIKELARRYVRQAFGFPEWQVRGLTMELVALEYDSDA